MLIPTNVERLKDAGWSVFRDKWTHPEQGDRSFSMHEALETLSVAHILVEMARFNEHHQQAVTSLEYRLRFWCETTTQRNQCLDRIAAVIGLIYEHSYEELTDAIVEALEKKKEEPAVRFRMITKGTGTMSGIESLRQTAEGIKHDLDRDRCPDMGRELGRDIVQAVEDYDVIAKREELHYFGARHQEELSHLRTRLSEFSIYLDRIGAAFDVTFDKTYADMANRIVEAIEEKKVEAAAGLDRRLDLLECKVGELKLAIDELKGNP